MGTGSGTGDWVDFRFLAQPTEQTRSTILNVPVQNITDNFTWTKGSHTFSLGGDWRYIQNNSDSDLDSYSSALNNAQWTTNAPNDPSTLGSSFPAAGAALKPPT